MTYTSTMLKDNGLAGLGQLFELERPHLRRYLERRINPKLASRLDASDVIQDVYFRAQKALPAYLSQPILPPLIWLRQLSLQVLSEVHRAQFRSLRNPFREEYHVDDSLVLSLVKSTVSIERKVSESELNSQIRKKLLEMNELDRQVLEMRHVDGYSLAEISKALDINYEAVKKRYYRALKRFKEMIGE